MSLLDFLRPRAKAPEYVGQVGSPFNVNPVQVPTGVSAGQAMAELEWTGDDYDTVATRPEPPRATRQWRLSSGYAAPELGPTNDGITVADDHHASATSRAQDSGQPDPRRGEADHAASPRVERQPFQETLVQVRPALPIQTEAAPNRTRAGWTGEDPTRAARMPFAFTLRPFDKGIADHPGAVVKAGQANPTAARPPDRKRLIGGRPSAAGSEGSQMNPVGAQPNTIRQAPAPWDTRIVNPGTEAHPTTRRWGLR